MARRRYKVSKKPVGTSPGTLTYVGQEIKHETKVKRIEYNEVDYNVDESSRLSACQLPHNEAPHVLWIDVDGIHEAPVVAKLGQQFRLHPLLLEDVMNTEQKPKIDLYDDHRVSAPVVYVTMKMLHPNPRRQEIDPEHVSFVLGANYLISFQEERTNDIFKPVLDRIQASSGKTRRNGADYLLYALMDLIVDSYFVVVERLGEKLDDVEDRIIRDVAGRDTLAILYALKREMTFMRRHVQPLRDILGTLLREETPLVHPPTLPFLRDLLDHVNQIIETIDSYRELIPGLLDVYLSTTSNRMNSVMKTLTIVSAIFIPLTFIAGIYGMNFDNMPELHTRTGYFWVMGIMVAIAAGEIIYFKRRGWM
ncbi:magnesium and cobalt transport protein CorA [Fibrella aestuarina BUZ 2]|uniref:Magnesium transport protein CorA n=1 Tax=Fibrella aestuarina BUZ 2 TaxID=1166018 RepID=I0KA02_9BACT|nr:magnesium/cobalt transporter CorA [Fibrella aestuarina]CCH00955.1 magnesium and cobalt transport protein CorA [Fibrella aestuarina BUZ 2]